MHLRIPAFLFAIIFCCLATCGAVRHTNGPADFMDLSGVWHYELLGDSLPAVRQGEVSLPGTLDSNGVGFEVEPGNETTQLSRRHTYTGRVSYRREVDIPEWGQGKHKLLTLERTRPTQLRVDGVDAGMRTEISGAQYYDLTPWLSPGRHTIEVIVDNGKAIPLAVRNSSHACTESTQTNWNGILGEISIRFLEPDHFVDVRVTPDVDKGVFKATGTVFNTSGRKLYVKGYTAAGDETVEVNADGSYSVDIPAEPNLWSEWRPELQNIDMVLVDNEGNEIDRVQVTGGLRSFSAPGTQFAINGVPTFLRGRHDACVWPLTAHVPMDKESWTRYFSILRQYGLNHVRFHSWCPPEACFQAADEAGIYLQPELTIWGEIDKENPALLDFLHKDMEAILAQYGHHPSFAMFAVGNELWGDTALMGDFINRAREAVPGLLATYGSNVYLGWNGHLPGEDYLVTCRVGGGEGFSTHARASFSFADADNGGIMNSYYPGGQVNFATAVSKSPVPVVSHETGQYQVYPDYGEISKYNGVLRPDNLTTFRDRAEKAGTLRKADKYFRASGAWAAKLYKADMEMELRTPGIGGFQLLDLQDYPGQGTALVGMLDAFMDSKGLITEKDWLSSCNEVTVLAEFPKYCWADNERVEIPVKVADYGAENRPVRNIRWKTPFAEGETEVSPGHGLLDAGTITIVLPKVKKPRRETLDLTLEPGGIKNSYDFWIYPQTVPEVKGVTVTTDLDDALAFLEKGERVVYCPDSATVSSSSIDPLFQTDYWNYRMFKTICDNVSKKPSPGTLGLLIDNDHPVFNSFPTDPHTDWQWFSVATNACPLIIDRLPASVDPIIEPIDNVERNYRLAVMLEMNVGKGKLVLLTVDPERVEKTVEGRWFMHSVCDYAASKGFKPQLALTPQQLRNLVTKPSVARTMNELNNISY